jgi:hypothetical protein
MIRLARLAVGSVWLGGGSLGSRASSAARAGGGGAVNVTGSSWHGGFYGPPGFVGDGVKVVHFFPPRIGVVQVTDGFGGGGVAVDVVGVGTGTGEKPVLRLNVGVGVVVLGVGVGVVGALAVLTPPVISCVVAIGRLGLAAR